MPKLPDLPDPPGLGIFRSRTGSGRNAPRLQAELVGHPETRASRRSSSTSATVRPSTPGVSASGVTRDPVERHEQRCRVVHEVEQVIEPAAGIGRRPTVKLGLHPRYPSRGPMRASRQARRRYSPAPLSALQPPSLLDTAAALPHVHGLSPARSTTAAPPHPDPIGGRCAQPASSVLDARTSGRTGTVPVFTVIRSTEEEPDSVPAASPRLPRSTSPWSPGRHRHSRPRSSPPLGQRSGAHRSRPISARFEPVRPYEGRNHAGSSRTPFRPARRTRTIWQYWHVPALSGLLPPSPAPPGSGCPQLHRLLRQGRR